MTRKSIPLKKNSYIDQENCNSAFCTVQYDEKINGSKSTLGYFF